jgi:serine protease Do
MKSPLPTAFLTHAVLAAILAFAPFARAADAKPSTPAKPAAHPPLKLQVDTRPINRDGPDRVSYAPVVKKTAASVVFVYSTKKIKRADLSPFLNDPMFKHFFDIPGHGGGRMPPQVEQGLGSGVVISTDGYILTNNHVVDDADTVQVSIGESTKKLDAKVIGRDALADVAVLKIEPAAPLTIPRLTDWPIPNGSPIARTTSPTSN